MKWVMTILPTCPKQASRVAPFEAREGVRHACLRDPTLRTLEILRLHNGSWLITGVCQSEDRGQVGPFEAVEIDLMLIWGSGAEPTDPI
jgi:hypothetical protein